jgi:hypothetical protein
MLVKQVRGYVISTSVAKGMSFSQSSSDVQAMRLLGLLVIAGFTNVSNSICDSVVSLIVITVSDMDDVMVLGGEWLLFRGEVRVFTFFTNFYRWGVNRVYMFG